MKFYFFVIVLLFTNYAYAQNGKSQKAIIEIRLFYYDSIAKNFQIEDSSKESIVDLLLIKSNDIFHISPSECKNRIFQFSFNSDSCLINLIIPCYKRSFLFNLPNKRNSYSNIFRIDCYIIDTLENSAFDLNYRQGDVLRMFKTNKSGGIVDIISINKLTLVESNKNFYTESQNINKCYLKLLFENASP